MKQFAIKKSKNSRLLFKYGYLLLAILSIIALIFTFAISISDFELDMKVMAFALIVVSYVSIYTIVRLTQKGQIVEIRETDKDVSDIRNLFDSDVDEKLLVLEEAGKFFGASLKSADMFRLISSRISEIIPYKTCAFFIIDKNNVFTVPFAKGRNSRFIESIRIECSEGIAGKAFLSGEVERDKNLVVDKQKVDGEFLQGLNSAIAAPMFRGTEIFAVLVLYSEKKNNYKEKDEQIIEAVAERVTPLVTGSFSFERSLSNALTDSITNLPNERAFYLVLESRVAEAQRFQDKQTLTVLAMDIKNFAEINQKYGHSTGDRVLAYSADIIQEQLRRMDILARLNNDEFLVVLPTATDMITDRIVERIQSAFVNRPFEISSTKHCDIELSFGSATFLDDGETANQLMRTALLRKQQSKSTGKNSVILFPKQYVN